MDRDDLAISIVNLTALLLKRHPELLLNDSDYATWKAQVDYTNDWRIIETTRMLAPTLRDYLKKFYCEDIVKAPEVKRQEPERSPMDREKLAHGA